MFAQLFHYCFSTVSDSEIHTYSLSSDVFVSFTEFNSSAFSVTSSLSPPENLEVFEDNFYHHSLHFLSLRVLVFLKILALLDYHSHYLI
mmetsp:Transcript_9735/g.12329  ORF Transcript_9735/g.12329 Transcript_9735/m.12329 type:complete len:89 (+) Transcript_9735:123-389(+)